MNEFSEECLVTFLRKQEQLFAEPVAETVEEAEAFLEDCMAVVVDTLEEVKEYFEENGMDVEGMSMDELEEACDEFGQDIGEAVKQGAEYCDVTIRCYLLGQAINVALDELEEEGKIQYQEEEE